MLTFGFIFGFCLLTSATYGFLEQSVPMVQQENAPSVDEILDRLKAHDDWQRRYLIEYLAQRKFSAPNSTSKEYTTREAWSTIRPPHTLDAEVPPADAA